MRFYALEKLMHLHDGYSRNFKIDHFQLLLVQRKGELFLVESICPHREHPLDVATFANDIVECALHQYQFSLRDGSLIHATEEPCRALRTFEIVYEGTDVGVMLEDELALND